MKYTMTVSPDFPPTFIPGWYIFNTWLQQALDVSIHLELYESFEDQRKAIENNEIDLIYANPFDASMLVREKGFSGLVKPENKSDEIVVLVPIGSAISKIEDIPEGARIVKTDDPDVNMIGMMILEPADLNSENTVSEQVDTYALVAKRLITGDADVGFYLKDTFDIASNLVKKQLRVLVHSQINDICHVLMAAPSFTKHADKMQVALLDMAGDAKGQHVLEELGLSAWLKQDHEDTEFMIDLMETLT